VAEITKSGVANLGSQEDLKNIKHALEADGSLTVVDDPEVEVEQDEEGNDLPPEQAVAVSGPVEIKVDADEAAAEEEEEEEE
jgi:hypothetical protein